MVWWYVRHGTGLGNAWKPLAKGRSFFSLLWSWQLKICLWALPELTACIYHLHLPVKWKLLNSTCQRGAPSLKRFILAMAPVGACGSPGPHFHPADPGAAGDINSYAPRDIQASRELREASSLPHISKV